MEFIYIVLLINFTELSHAVKKESQFPTIHCWYISFQKWKFYLFFSGGYECLPTPPFPNLIIVLIIQNKDSVAVKYKEKKDEQLVLEAVMVSF